MTLNVQSPGETLRTCTRALNDSVLIVEVVTSIVTRRYTLQLATHSFEPHDPSSGHTHCLSMLLIIIIIKAYDINYAAALLIIKLFIKAIKKINESTSCRQVENSSKSVYEEMKGSIHEI